MYVDSEVVFFAVEFVKDRFSRVEQFHSVGRDVALPEEDAAVAEELGQAQKWFDD